jgi:uncharacterized membrane protein YccF (DUF307 family)
VSGVLIAFAAKAVSWFLVFGFWFLVFGFWFLVFGFWFLVFGLVACGDLVCRCSCPVGLSLLCYRSISFAPVRGSTHFLCRRKESKQRKRAHTASP